MPQYDTSSPRTAGKPGIIFSQQTNHAALARKGGAVTARINREAAILRQMESRTRHYGTSWEPEPIPIAHCQGDRACAFPPTKNGYCREVHRWME